MSESKKSDFKRYLEIETIGGARWHPSEDKVVFISDTPGNYQVFTASILENKPSEYSQLTDSDNRSTNPYYLADGTIIFLRDEGGNENFQIYCIHENKEIKISQYQNSKYIILFTTQKYLYYRANIDSKARFDIYRLKLPILDNEPEKIFEPTNGVPYSLVPLDDALFAIQIAYGNIDHEILYLDYDTKEVYSLTNELTQELKYRWNPIKWINKSTLLVATDYSSDLFKAAFLTIDGTFIPIETVEQTHELSSVTWTEQSERIFLVYNHEGYSSLYEAKINKDLKIKQWKKIDLPLKGVIGAGDSRSFTQALTISSDCTYLAFTFTSPVSPTSIWILNLSTYKSWKALEPYTSGLEPKDFIDAELNHFESFDGLSVPYFKYIPEGETPSKGWPSIIIVHGGPESQIRPSFIPQIQFFLSLNYAVVTPNIRGSTGYGRTYMDLDNKEKRLDSIRDLKELAHHISRDPKINGDKLIIYGGSYGGFAVLSAMTEHPEIWAAGVDIVGISNFVTFLKNTADWRRKLREAEYGSLDEDLELLERISPMNKIDQIQAPLFVIHGDNDERVPLSETLQMYQKMKEKGLLVELLRFPDEGHGITKLENKLTAYSKIVQWLENIL